MRHRITTSNVRGYPRMTEAQYVHAIDRILERGGADCVRFGQEVGWHPTERNVWFRLMAQEGLSTFGMDRLGDHWSPDANPISLSLAQWNVTYNHVEYRQTGTEEQPQRVITRVNAYRQDVPITFVNLHNYSQAGKDRAHRQAWMVYWTALRRIVHAAYDEGYNVIVGGDTNTFGLGYPDGRPPKLFPNIGVEAVWNAPDGIWLAAQPHMKARVVRSWKIPEWETGLDHVTIGACVEWMEK